MLKPAAAPALPLFGQSAESDIISSLGLPIVDDEPVQPVAPLPSLPPTVAVAAVAAAAPAAPAPASKPAPKRKRASAAASSASASTSTSISTSPATVDTTLTAPSSLAGTPGAALAEGVELDEHGNQVALEEDKRRRNTAASARFRVKKKMREAALESTAKELRDRVEALEREVDGLRTENGWLKGMLVEGGTTANAGDSTLARLENEGLIARKRPRTDELDFDSILV